MARKTLVREVTHTVVSVGRVSKGKDGLPSVEVLDDIVMIDNVTQEKAQREVNKMFEDQVTVFGVEPNTKKYKMPIEKFIELAEEVVDEGDQEVPDGNPLLAE